MKKFIFYSILVISLAINLFYFNNKIERGKHKEEFVTLFKIKNISYQNGFLHLNEKLHTIKNEKPYHLIHVWDTFFVESKGSIPYNLQIDSFFKINQFKNVDCILMSSMRDKTIESFLNPRKINLNSLTILNEMDDYISGVFNKRGKKTKIRSANILINQQGDILYYNDKIKYALDKDSLLLKTIYSLK